MSGASGGVARLFMTRAGELRAAWRLFLFVLLFVAVLALFSSVQPWLHGLTGLSAAAAGSVGVLTGATVAGIAMLVAIDHRRPGALGFGLTRSVPRELVLGLAVTGGALTVCVAGLAFAGLLDWTREAGSAGGYIGQLARDLALWGVAAAAEEALFRGYLFQVIVQGMGAPASTVLVSVLFALAHVDNPGADVLALANIFLAGVLLSVAYLRTRSLWFSTALHAGWNWMMGTVLALPVSGLVLVKTPLYAGHLGEPAWLTGGAFGVEGGVVATVAFTLALAAVALAPLAEAPRMRGLRPLVDSRLRR